MLNCGLHLSNSSTGEHNTAEQLSQAAMACEGREASKNIAAAAKLCFHQSAALRVVIGALLEYVRSCSGWESRDGQSCQQWLEPGVADP